MNELNLVKNINGEVYTDSKLIAEKFGKEHKNVLRDIENLASQIGDTKLFIESTYKNRGKDYKCYLVSETGLQLYLFNIQGFVQEKLEYINQFNAMKQMIVDLQLGKPKAIIGLLTWKNTNMETTIRTYVNGGNVLNVIPAIVDACKAKIDSGEMKISIIATIIRTLESMREEETIIGNRDNYATAILDTNHKLRHIQNTRLGGTVKANNDLKVKIAEKNKELRDVETKRLKDFSRKSLINAYEDSGIIQDLVDDIVRNVLTCDEKDAFKANLKANVKLIVDNSNLTWEEAYTAIYNAMGLFTKPATYKTMVDYIWDYELDKKCLDAAVRVRARFGC